MYFLIKKGTSHTVKESLDVCHLVPGDLVKRVIIKYSLSNDGDIISYNFELS